MGNSGSWEVILQTHWIYCWQGLLNNEQGTVVLKTLLILILIQAELLVFRKKTIKFFLL